MQSKVLKTPKCDWDYIDHEKQKMLPTSKGTFTPTLFGLDQNSKRERCLVPQSGPKGQNLVQPKEVVSVRITLKNGLVRLQWENTFCVWFRFSDQSQEFFYFLRG